MRAVRRGIAVAASVSLLALLGCDGKNPGNPAGGGAPGSGTAAFVTKVAPIEFTFPAGWHANPEEHPFDLQCLSRSEDMNTGVFVFRKEDLALDATPADIFGQQVDDLKSKRRNLEEMEALQRREAGDKTVTSVTFLGDKDSSRNCYTFSLVEFRADDSRFAVVLQVSKPGGWKASKPVLEAIVQSARMLPELD